MNATLKAPGHKASLAPDPSQTNPSRRILVVDDNDGIRYLNTQALLRSGCEVDAAVDRADAWQALDTNRYDRMITVRQFVRRLSNDLEIGFKFEEHLVKTLAHDRVVFDEKSWRSLG